MMNDTVASDRQPSDAKVSMDVWGGVVVLCRG